MQHPTDSECRYVLTAVYGTKYDNSRKVEVMKLCQQARVRGTQQLFIL